MRRTMILGLPLTAALSAFPMTGLTTHAGTAAASPTPAAVSVQGDANVDTSGPSVDPAPVTTAAHDVKDDGREVSSKARATATSTKSSLQETSSTVPPAPSAPAAPDAPATPAAPAPATVPQPGPSASPAPSAPAPSGPAAPAAPAAPAGGVDGSAQVAAHIGG